MGAEVHVEGQAGGGGGDVGRPEVEVGGQAGRGGGGQAGGGGTGQEASEGSSWKHRGEEGDMF